MSADPADRSASLVAANVWALALAVPLLALLVVPFGLAWGWAAVADGAAWWADRPLTALGALVLGVLAHETLHAAAWRMAARLPPGSVRLGFNWKALTPYAHCSAAMPARAYRIGAATPGVALGLVPAALALATGSGPLLAFSLLFTLAAGGDALILVLLRGVPPGTRVVDHPTRAGCLVVDPAPEPDTQAVVQPDTLPIRAMLPATTHLFTAPVSRAADWARAVSYEAFLPTAAKNADLWTGIYERFTPPEDALARAAALPGHWNLLVLSEDWCGDASNTVPMLARLAAAVPTLDLRLLARDENLALTDEHLTGTSRGIPVVIALDGALVERGWWGPRPADLQAWVLSEGLKIEDHDERYRQVRTWYARDRGQTTLREVLDLLDAVSGGRTVI